MSLSCVFCCWLLAISPAFCQDPTEPLSPEQQAIRKNAESFVVAFDKGDAKAVAALWAENGEMSLDGEAVAVGREQIDTAEEYYDQASQIATAGQAQTDDNDQWMLLGVWAMVKGDETESNNILELAVNKKGVIRGNHYNATNDVTQPLQGSVEGTTQRVAWTIGDNDQVVFETGVSNLTNEETEMLIHYGSGRTEQWTLVRLEEPAQDNTLSG